MDTFGIHTNGDKENRGELYMTWFEKGNKVAWVKNGKNIETSGVIKEILKPGECAEDYLTPEEQTKMSTKKPNIIFRPDTCRALVEVTDHHGYITYHMPMVNRLRKMETTPTEQRKHTTTIKTLARKT